VDAELVGTTSKGHESNTGGVVFVSYFFPVSDGIFAPFVGADDLSGSVGPVTA